MDGVQGIDDILFFHANLLGNFVDGGLFEIFFDVIFFGIDGFVCSIAKRAAYPDRVVVPQIPADLTDDHGNRVSRKFHVQCCIEIVNCLHQPDAANLE